MRRSFVAWRESEPRVVVGTGRLARRTVRTLRAVNWSGIQPVGLVEDEPHRNAGTDLPVLGVIAELPELVEKHHIEHVFIAVPAQSLRGCPPRLHSAFANGRGRATHRRPARDGRHDFHHDADSRHDRDWSAREPAPRPEHRRETRNGHPAVVAGDHSARPAYGRDCAHHQTDQPRPDSLPAGTLRPQRAVVHDAEVPARCASMRKQVDRR